MKTAFIILVVLVGTVILAHLIASRMFQAGVARQEDAVRGAPVPVARSTEEIPEPLRSFAARALAGEGGMPRAVYLTQEVEMLRGDAWLPSAGRQHIAIATPDFAWIAESPGWIVPTARVIDRYTGGQGRLEVRILGSIRAGSFTGPEADIGEAMRYLAEIVWAPDAILANTAITWRPIDASTVEGDMTVAERTATVRFHFNEAGDVVEITAEGRPAVEGDEVILRDWQGRFSGYEEIGGRRIPRFGEIGYIIDSAYAPYFRARILSYQMLR